MTAEASRATDLDQLLDQIDDLLGPDRRKKIVDGMSRTGSFDDQLKRLRTAMSAHAFSWGDGRVDLTRPVRRLDQRTRQDGFRVLHAWNHTSHAFTDDIVPVLLLDFFERTRGSTAGDRLSLEILLDYYMLHLLALCVLRAWDSSDPDAVFDRVTGLVDALQGEHGSGHRFVTDAETLLIYAISQFHPEEQAYDRVIDRVGTLDVSHQVAFARVGAAVLSAHLRWGFWLMYGRDVVRMRADNTGDYPWLLNSVLTLMRAFVESMDAGRSPGDRGAIGESLLLGLAADPWAFGGKPPAALGSYADDYAELRDLLARHGDAMLTELEPFRPERDRYAPLSLHFNFPHNTLVAIVTLALLEGRPQALPLNALFERGEPGEEGGEMETRETLARTLMAFSRASPDRLGYRGAMLVAYDPLSGMRSFTMAMKELRRNLA